ARFALRRGVGSHVRKQSDRRLRGRLLDLRAEQASRRHRGARAEESCKSFLPVHWRYPSSARLFDHLVASGEPDGEDKRSVCNETPRRGGTCCNPNPDFTDMVRAAAAPHRQRRPRPWREAALADVTQARGAGKGHGTMTVHFEGEERCQLISTMQLANSVTR